MSNIERIQCGNGNAYLLYDGENAVLIDTCRNKYKEKILERCKTKNVRLIVLTHGHIDHIQNAAFLSKELNAPIAIHKADIVNLLFRIKLADIKRLAPGFASFPLWHKKSPIK